MKSIYTGMLLILVLLLSAGCIPVPVLSPGPGGKSGTSSIPVNVPEPAIVNLSRIESRLRSAPWQGLRFLPEAQTWRFYGISGERQVIELIQPVILIRVYYLDTDNQLRFTWAATEIRFSGEPSFTLASQSLLEGQLITVELKGDHVTQNGVIWEKCDSEFYNYANMIDHILVLDELGTGISNAWIRFGWPPPAWPLYGFLCWQLSPVEEMKQHMPGQHFFKISPDFPKTITRTGKGLWI